MPNFYRFLNVVMPMLLGDSDHVEEKWRAGVVAARSLGHVNLT